MLEELVKTGCAAWRRAPRAKGVVAALALLVLGFLAACATQKPATAPPKPGTGAEEYRRLTSESAAAILEALRRLEDVDAQATRCPPQIVSAFADQVERLQVESIKVRARAKAIEARGEAYLEAWTAGGQALSEAPPPPAAERMPQVRESFARIKLASQETGQAYRQFFADLRRLRAELETDSGAIETAKTKDLIRSSREHGWQVLQKLGVLRHELYAIRSLLVQSRPAS